MNEHPSLWDALRLRAQTGRESAFKTDFYALPQAVQDALYGIAAELETAADALETYEKALRRIADQQPHTLGWMRDHGIVFDGPLGRDPKNWQHVAFSVYTDLCEVDTWARSALDEVSDA